MLGQSISSVSPEVLSEWISPVLWWLWLGYWWCLFRGLRLRPKEEA